MENSIIPITPFVHVAMLVLTCITIAASCAIGIKFQAFGTFNLYSKCIGIFTLAFWALYNMYYFHPNVFRWDVSLPLQACDILGIVASLTMIFPSRTGRAIVYFWSFSLASQAFITPTGNQDPENLRFWCFWGLHISIFICVFLDIFVRRYRPVFIDYILSMTSLVTYALILLPVDIKFGWNYGYIGNTKPDVATVLDLLGEWPGRLFWMLLIVMLLQLVLLLPWLLPFNLFRSQENKLRRNNEMHMR